MKTVCIYHSIDLDGWMSAAIVKHWFLNDRDGIDPKYRIVFEEGDGYVSKTINGQGYLLDFIGYNYGQSIPDLYSYDKVIMCDISFDNTTMFNIVNILNKELVWIDHHISAIKSNVDVELVDGIRDTKFAACELTWMHFFPNEPIPEIVHLLGRYDCFGHKGTDEEQKVLEFQYGARMVIDSYNKAYEFLLSNINLGVNVCESIHIDGAAIYRYLCTEAKQSYKNGFDIKFDNLNWDTPNHYPGMPPKLKFICINKERFNPINFGIDYHKDGYDGAACFHYANGMWNFSLYNDNGLVDCSVIAKKYGGGGHKGAAGFKVVDLSLIYLFKTLSLSH